MAIIVNNVGAGERLMYRVLLVDDEQIERERGEVLLVPDARAAEGIMGSPILRNAG